MFRLEYLYWKIIQALIANGEYRILQLSQSNHEIWLESTTKKKPGLLRIMRTDLDWSNWMQRDMEITAHKVEKLRQRFFMRKVDAINLYISTYPPVDDWRYRLEKPLVVGKRGQSSLHSILLHLDEVEDGINSLSEKVGIPFSIEDEGLLTDQGKIEVLKHTVLMEANQRIRNEQNLFQNGKPFFTYILMAIQLIMFAILELNGGSTNTGTLLKYGAKENVLLLEGEWWRFFTPMFLHIGIFHLLMNTLALYYLGTAVERIFGRTRFVFIYLFAGILGSLASFAFSSAVSAGASGAIFGCFGALVYFGTVYPSLFFRTMGSNVIGIIIINLVFGFVVPGIDNAGHIGGLIGGFLASSIVHFPKRKRMVKQLLGAFAAFLVVVGLLFVGYQLQPQSDSAQFKLSLAQKKMDEKQYEEAYQLLQEVIEKEDERSTAEMYFYLSYVEIKLGKFDQAKDHLLIVTEKNSTLPEAYFNLALVYVQLGDYQKAKESAEEAIKINPENQSYQDLAKEIEEYLK